MNTPNHVGFIIDGNRRWAKARAKTAIQGHKAGFDVFDPILRHADKKGINHITFYVWSLKNEAGRSKDERSNIFGLIVKALHNVIREAKKNEVRIQFFGRWQNAVEVKKEIAQMIDETKHFTKKSLNFCFMYDGHAEIADACQAIIDNGITQVDEKTVKAHLYSKEVPPLDLIIRTGMNDGVRLSGFMLWDASYTELIFHDIYWPDYTAEQLDADLGEFARRNRRFGA